MRSGGGSFGRIGVHVGEDWWTHLSTYDIHAPIFTIDAGSTSVTLSIDGREVTAAAVEFGRELASQAARFAAELERLHAWQNQADGTSDGIQDAPARGAS
jgi:hypothetical protein